MSCGYLVSVWMLSLHSLETFEIGRLGIFGIPNCCKIGPKDLSGNAGDAVKCVGNKHSGTKQAKICTRNLHQPAILIHSVCLSQSRDPDDVVSLFTLGPGCKCTPGVANR